MPMYRVTFKVRTVIIADNLHEALDAGHRGLTFPDGLYEIDGEVALIKQKPKWWRQRGAITTKRFIGAICKFWESPE